MNSDNHSTDESSHHADLEWDRLFDCYLPVELPLDFATKVTIEARRLRKRERLTATAIASVLLVTSFLSLTSWITKHFALLTMLPDRIARLPEVFGRLAADAMTLLHIAKSSLNFAAHILWPLPTLAPPFFLSVASVMFVVTIFLIQYRHRISSI